MSKTKALLITVAAAASFAQTPNLPDPNGPGIQNWAKFDARPWGAASAISIDSHENIWVLERCGANTCAGKTEDPILEFDPSGKFVKSFGSGMFVFPHGIFVDSKDHVWATDADRKDGKGNQVFEFSSDGKVLMQLGKPG